MRYYLYERPLHPELFEIHHSDHLVRRHFEAQIWVTGCTHVIGFFHEGLSLVEVIAAEDNALPARGRLLELPFRGEKDHECVHANGIRYMMNFQVERMSEKVYGKTHHEFARQGSKRGLFVPFPMWMTRPPLTPFSYIDSEARSRGLHVFAFHAFPEDLTLIKIQTIFELT